MSYRLADTRMLTLHVTSADEALQSAQIFPKLRSIVIPNGVDIPAQAARELGLSKLRLLYLGRLHPIKGIEVLVEACALVSKHFSNFCLRIVGSGTPGYVASLKAIIEDRGLRDKVEFLGEVTGNSKEAVFEESDVVVVPSHVENFAMVVAESLAHGIPVIASKGTPWSDLERRGCGLWVDNRPEALSEAICRIREMPLRDMGDRGKRWMQEQYSWDFVGSQMLRLYRECSDSRLITAS
jgi:glycosyltransferase involved in cell wall biosynthesis